MRVPAWWTDLTVAERVGATVAFAMVGCFVLQSVVEWLAR
jgi:hypothetical protein